MGWILLCEDASPQKFDENLNSPKYVTYTMQQEFQIWLAYLNINQRLFCIKRPIFSIFFLKLCS